MKAEKEFVFGWKEGTAPLDAFTEEECRRLGLDPPGSRFHTKDEAKRAAERYQWQLDLRRAKAEMEDWKYGRL